MSTPPLSALSADEITANKMYADNEFAEAVDSKFLAIAGEAGVLVEGKLDKKIVAKLVYGLVRTKHVVTIEPENDDRRDPTKSTSKEELAAEIFATMPTGSAADLNGIDAAVRGRCLDAVWDVTQTGERGAVQKLLRADNLILIRGTVFRGTLTVSSGLYVSTHVEVVLREFLAPRLERLRKLTEAIKSDYDLATDRSSELAGPMKDAIEAALVEATAKLPVATLGTGGSNGQKALGK
jgi:hypothetical protein